MTRKKQFRYARPPRFVEYIPTFGLAALAAVLTLAAITSAFDFEQVSVSPGDYYGTWIIAAIAWIGTFAAGLAVWRRRKAYQNEEPAIAVDEQGITVRGMFGKPLDLMWSDVLGLELEQRSGKSAVLIKSSGVSGAVPLDNLNVNPLAAWEVVRRFQERHSR